MNGISSLAKEIGFPEHVLVGYTETHHAAVRMHHIEYDRLLVPDRTEAVIGCKIKTNSKMRRYFLYRS